VGRAFAPVIRRGTALATAKVKQDRLYHPGTGFTMRLGEIRRARPPRFGLAPQAAEPAPAGPAKSRALTVTAPPASTEDKPSPYRQAPFLAQLIAAKDQHPQMRERRRATPTEAIAAYRAALMKWR
jgi:hypothetical protein